MYRDYFPLLALARYAKALADPSLSVSEPNDTRRNR
jgi:hypothetical protein